MALEDIASIRAVHGSTVLHPCDANQTAKLVEKMADLEGISYLRTLRPATPVVYGPDEQFEIGGSRTLREGDEIEVPGIGARFSVLDVPGHTAGHIAYVGDGVAFVGDTLFACGCGRLFEGTAAQMSESLGKLARLPGGTRAYCAHEYTLANIKFAEAVEPANMKLKARRNREIAKRQREIGTRSDGSPWTPTGRSSLATTVRPRCLAIAVTAWMPAGMDSWR